MKYEPMLAQPSSTLAPSATLALQILLGQGGWRFEIKFDGVRVITEITDNKVQMWSRRGLEMSWRYPEVVPALLDTYGGKRIVLDGEMIVCVNGVPDFPAIHRRDSQGTAESARRASKVAPAQYILFDLPEDRRPYAARHMILSEHKSRFGDLDRLGFSECYEDGEMMWAFAEQHNLEGLVAKRGPSPYRAGRSHDWIKLKRLRRLTAVVIGNDPGAGSRAGQFGHLKLALLRGTEVVSIGNVGSGFSQRELAEVGQLLSRKEPFAVEVEYLDVSPTGQLRQPVFLGVRSDVGVLSCTIDQLEN